MLNLLKYISFYFAFFILVSITFIFLGASKYHGYLQLFIWLGYCGIILSTLSYMTDAYKLSYWSEAETIGPSILIGIGHLGPAHAVYYYIQMAKANYGSGIAFIPSILWSFLFYGIGVFWCMARIAEVKYPADG